MMLANLVEKVSPAKTDCSDLVKHSPGKKSFSFFVSYEKIFLNEFLQNKRDFVGDARSL